MTAAKLANCRFLSFSVIGVLTLLGGCGETVDLNKHQQLQQQTVQRKIVDELFTRSIQLIEDVEHSDSADLIDQSVNSLNQWAESLQPLPDWQLDPLAQTLPDEVKASSLFKRLEKLTFGRGDAFALQEAIWMRQAGKHIAGKISDPLAKAETLFDWIVLQVALERPADQKIGHAAWETILRGRGTAVDRLWTFVLLARQQGLDVVVLGLEKDEKSTPWAAGLWHQKQLYLFDPELGLPIRNATGKLATLAEVTAQPELLAALAVDAEHPYRIAPDELKQIVAWVEASPPYLAQRFRHVELRLVGDERLALSTDASALAEQLKKSGEVRDAKLWPLPWERLLPALARDPQYLAALVDVMRPFRVPNSLLWKGRVLHLGGKYTGDLSAVRFYLDSRPTGQEVSLLKDSKDTRFQDLQKAVPIAKQDATYWLGLIAYERGNYPTAIEHFEKRLLKAFPDSRWKSAAEFQIARAHEAAGDKAKAIEAYERVSEPARSAALVRAKQLKAAK
ncbi:MAG: tetratricopeptide repeat protein [Planctomycetaceae bacterium]|nr:tetratricopeptide repeat protein [Planctomycetaceae bacterium]